jgi:serine/threonine-protein kinase
MEPRPPADLARRLGDVLRGEQDRALGRRAVRAGFLSDGELEDLLAGGGGLERQLRERGVSADDLRRLRSELDREEYALFSPDHRVPPEVAAVQGDPARRLAEFVLVSSLGRGGIGEVWKAWDTRLGRWVAIKLPRPQPDPEAATRRFTREALAAARVSHPNIVAIHRVAEERGRCFIVMQYVEGRPLGAERPGWKGALEILRVVATAVHHAHELGVVHRDLKPGNILIAPDGRPFILDFGLAHLEESAWLQSREGLVAGTAAYMSPEQAMGGPAARGRSTDIYSLGATLYEVVAGRPPFAGATFAEILQKVLHDDPPAPRFLNRDVPPDVEAVILRAMDKEPWRRYATAKELAEDLDRCLRGESLAVRQGEFLHALRRRVKRHPLATFAVAAAILFVLVFGALEARRSAHHERQLRTIRDLSGGLLEAVLALRRVAANPGMGELQPRLEAYYREAVAGAPDRAEPYCLMGRVERALMNDARALELQELALAKDPACAPALYERIVLSTRRGARATEELERDGERLRALLEKDAPAVGPVRVGAAHGLAARGMIALARGDAAGARGLLEQALSADAGLEEAWELLGAARRAAVSDRSSPSEREAACDGAEEAFTRGIARDLGYAFHWAGRAEARGARARLKRETGRDPLPDLHAAEDDAARAMALSPAVDGHRRLAELRTLAGAHRMDFGGNPLEDFAEAEAHLASALARNPRDAQALVAAGVVRRHRARYRVERGESPEDDVRAGEDEARRALEIDRALPGAWLNRAVLQGWRALHRRSSDGDFESALRCFEEALRAGGEDAEVLERRAWLRLEKGDLAGAEADAGRAAELAPFLVAARVTRAAALRRRAVEPGAPATLFARAREELAEALRVNPLAVDAWIEQGHNEYEWGRHRTRSGEPAVAREHFAQANRSFEEALRLNPFLSARLRAPQREVRQALLR